MCILRAVSSLLMLLTIVAAHSDHRAACPLIRKPMENFNADLFLGEWYVMKGFDPDVTCLQFNYTSCGPACLRVQEIKQLNVLHNLGVSNVYETDGKLHVRGNTAADMTASFTTNPRLAIYTVLATDYVNFAAVYTCQNIGSDTLPAFHRRDVYLMTRQRGANLTQGQVEQVSGALIENLIEDEFEDVSHSECLSREEVTLNINASKIGQRVSAVASTVSNGFSRFASAVAGLFSVAAEQEPAAAASAVF